MNAELRCGRYTLDLSEPKVMGIVNVTPDSFSDGGQTARVADAIARAELMLEQGAHLLDIGGESTRPGAERVSVSEEIDRVVPVVEALGASALVSVDTSKAQVMQAAIAAGASMINDVYALQLEGALEAVAATDAGVCLMHMQGTPDMMQKNPQYDDVVAQVSQFLAQRVEACVQGGIDAERVVLDPGFGFGKRVEHNLSLLRHLSDVTSHNRPILAGLSRKSMLQKLLNLATDERMTASVCLGLIAVKNGARILRVHDVRETVQGVRLWQAVAQA